MRSGRQRRSACRDSSLQLVAEGIDQILCAEDGDQIVVQAGDDQLVREAAHPLRVHHIGLDLSGCRVQLAGILQMQNAAGERVAVHHVEQRGCVIRFLNHGGRERQQIFDLRRLLERDLAGLAVGHVFFGIIAACGWEFFIFGIACPDSIQNCQRVRNVRRCLLSAAFRGAGRQRNCRHHGKQHCDPFFHTYDPPGKYSARSSALSL